MAGRAGRLGILYTNADAAKHVWLAADHWTQHEPKCSDRRPELFVDAWDEILLRCLVVILERDEEALQPPQRPKRHDQGQRNPKRGVNPIWRLIFNFSNQGGDDDDGTRDQYDEYGGPVADVREVEIQTARTTFGFQRQESVEELSLAAARASAQQPGGIW